MLSLTLLFVFSFSCKFLHAFSPGHLNSSLLKISCASLVSILTPIVIPICKSRESILPGFFFFLKKGMGIRFNIFFYYFLYNVPVLAAAPDNPALSIPSFSSLFLYATILLTFFISYYTLPLTSIYFSHNIHHILYFP